MKWIGLIALILKLQTAQSQSDSSNVEINSSTEKTDFRHAKFISSQWVIGLNYGAIWAHNDPVAHLAQSHPYQIFTEYHFQNSGKQWGKNFNNASAGLCLTYIDYQSKVLGKSLASIAFLEPWIAKNITFRLGTGLVFNSNPFNLETNNTNIMMGSSFALVMHAQLNFVILRQGVSPNKRIPLIKLGIGLTHFSNGAYTIPNSGMNNIFLSAGYCFGRQPGCVKNSISTPSKLISKPLSFGLSTSFSLVEKLPAGGKKYSVYQLQGRANYKIGKISILKSGLDLMYNEAIAADLNENPEKGNNAMVIGIPLGYELIISKNLSLVTEFGYYIYKKHSLHSSLYQRYGLKYFWWNGLYSAVYLKSHKAKAESFEINLGYQW